MPRISIQANIDNKIYPDRESFVKYYFEENHSQTETAAHFSITRPIVQSLVEFWHINKTPEQISSINARQVKNGKRGLQYKISQNIYPSKEKFTQYYIAENHSREETSKYFHISQWAVVNLSNYYNAHKTKEDIKITKQQTCLKKYGETSNSKTEESKKKMEQTCLKKYGVKHATQADSVKEKRRQTFIEKYGVEYALQNKEICNKMQQTIKEKYGVEWPCQLKSCVKKYRGSNSGPNLKFEEKLINNNIDFKREYALFNRNYDFKVNNILVEIDPWYTHQSTYETKFGITKKSYHADKSKLATQNGFHCIHIFDWDDENKILNIFLKNKEKCDADDCEIKEVSLDEEISFLNLNHLQGYVKSKICIGLYLHNELVQLISFGKPRYNKNYEYELLRLCSIKQVVGGPEKIFEYFLNKYNVNSVISYCDLSKFNGTIYDKLGFTLLTTAINKHWYSPKLKKHITDNLLRSQGFDKLLGNVFEKSDKSSDNNTLMKECGFVEIYDAGQATYFYNK